jgi:hypothetical protein
VIDIPVKNFVKANKRFPNTGELLDIEKETYRLFMLNTEVTDMNEKLLKIANDNEIVFIDRTKIGCSVTKEVCAVLTTSGALINYDYGHLSVLGAKWLGEHDQSIKSWNFFL